MSKEGATGQAITSLALSQLHAYSLSAPCDIGGTALAAALIWTFWEKEWLRVGKFYFGLEEELYLLVFIAIWEE